MAFQKVVPLTLLTLLYLHIVSCANVDKTIPLQSQNEPFTYEFIESKPDQYLASGSAEAAKGNYYQRVGIFHSRRQRRSPHIGGHGLAYRPVYVQQYPNHHHPHYGGHGLGVQQVGSNSHAQAHAVSANFGGPTWQAGFSGAAASAGSGSNQLNHLGYHGK